MDRVGGLSVEEFGEIVEEIRSESEAEEADSITVLVKYSYNEFLIYYNVPLPLCFREFKLRIAETTGIRNIGRIRYQKSNEYCVIESENDWDDYISYCSNLSEPKLFVEEEEEEIGFSNYSVVKICDGGNLGISNKSDTPIFIRQIDIVEDSSSKEVINLANSLRRLRHPNIVQIYRADKCKVNTKIIMEYIPDTLEIFTQKFELQENIMSYLFSVLQGLNFLHESGIILKDISQKNIRVTEFGRVTISLFHLLEYEVDPEKYIPLYLPKESFGNNNNNNNKRRFSKKTNVFQFGCVLYEILKKERIIIPKEYYEETEKERDSIIETLVLDDSISPQFKDFLRMCLSKDEEKRANVDELLSHPLMERERVKTIIEYRVNSKDSAAVFDLSSDSEDDDDENEGEDV